MADSRKERVVNIAANIGSISTSIDPYATDNQITTYESVGEGTHPIPAGQYRVDVYNEALTNITVNGDEVPPGNYWTARAFSNPATQKLDLTPAIEIIVPANSKASYSYDSPSA